MGKSETGDETAADEAANVQAGTAALPFEPSPRDPFWQGLSFGRVPQDIDLDYLVLDETASSDPAGFDDRPMNLRLRVEELPPVEDGLSDCVEETSPFLGQAEPQESLSLLNRVALDHCNYYSADTALIVGVASGLAATFAHSYVDEEIYRRVHHSVWHGDGHDWAVPLHATKILGEGSITLPVFGGVWLAGKLLDDVPLFDVAGTWGERSLRGFLVGGPPLLAMQYFTGGSRPMESESGSAWRPFQDTNGASGHAFMGALPLLTAAEMIDWWPGKIAIVVVSLFPGLSRVADDDHYASQAILGWTLAYVAVTAVDRTDNPNKHFSLFPLITGDHVGVAAEYRW